MTNAIEIGRGKVWAGSLAPGDRQSIEALCARGPADDAATGGGRRYRLTRPAARPGGA